MSGEWYKASGLSLNPRGGCTNTHTLPKATPGIMSSSSSTNISPMGCPQCCSSDSWVALSSFENHFVYTSFGSFGAFSTAESVKQSTSFVACLVSIVIRSSLVRGIPSTVYPFCCNSCNNRSTDSGVSSPQALPICEFLGG